MRIRKPFELVKIVRVRDFLVEWVRRARVRRGEMGRKIYKARTMVVCVAKV